MNWNVLIQKKFLVVFGLVIIVLILIVIFKLSPPKQTRPITTPIQVKTYSPMIGEVFSNVLQRAEIPSQSANQIIQTLQKIKFKFTSLKPTDTVKFFYRNDTLIKMELKKNYSTIYRFDNFTSGNITVAMAFKEITNQVKLVKGKISSSLYESMMKIGENPNLISNYSDILAWEIDFFTETQTGDSFYILVEKKFCDTLCVDDGQIIAVRYKGTCGDFSGFFFLDPKGNRDYYDSQGKSLRKAFLKSPLRYSHISSYFSRGRYHPILKIVRPHKGIDYVAPTGTPVSTIGDGTVTFAGRKSGYGRFVEISHSQRFKSRYGHLSRFGASVRSGRRISQGQIVGYVGATGLATGPHLHFELLQNGSWVNPLKIIPPRAEPVKPEYFSAFARHRDSILVLLNTQN